MLTGSVRRNFQNLRYFRCPVWKIEKLIKSKNTLKLKHANSILEYFEYFHQMPSKSILIVLSYTVSKFARFFWDTVYTAISITVTGFQSANWPERAEGLSHKGVAFLNVQVKMQSFMNFYCEKLLVPRNQHWGRGLIDSLGDWRCKKHGKSWKSSRGSTPHR